MALEFPDRSIRARLLLVNFSLSQASISNHFEEPYNVQDIFITQNICRGFWDIVQLGCDSNGRVLVLGVNAHTRLFAKAKLFPLKFSMRDPSSAWFLHAQSCPRSTVYSVVPTTASLEPLAVRFTRSSLVRTA